MLKLGRLFDYLKHRKGIWYKYKEGELVHESPYPPVLSPTVICGTLDVCVRSELVEDSVCLWWDVMYPNWNFTGYVVDKKFYRLEEDFVDPLVYNFVNLYKKSPGRFIMSRTLFTMQVTDKNGVYDFSLTPSVLGGYKINPTSNIPALSGYSLIWAHSEIKKIVTQRKERLAALKRERLTKRLSKEVL